MLRSIRYGEADRILHLFSASRGRIGAIAKGVRKPRSRFGGRLEPFFRLDLVLHEGRGDLATVTGGRHARRAPEPARRRGGAGRGVAGLRRGAAALRRRGAEPGRLQPALPLPLDPRRLGVARRRRVVPTARRGCRRRSRSGSSWRWRRGSRPSSARARAAARPTSWPGSRAPPAGWCARACERGGFALSPEAHAFMVEALGRPLAQAPPAGDRALRQAERAITETLEHHAHVQLRGRGLSGPEARDPQRSC